MIWALLSISITQAGLLALLYVVVLKARFVSNADRELTHDDIIRQLRDAVKQRDRMAAQLVELQQNYGRVAEERDEYKFKTRQLLEGIEESA